MHDFSGECECKLESLSEEEDVCTKELEERLQNITKLRKHVISLEQEHKQYRKITNRLTRHGSKWVTHSFTHKSPFCSDDGLTHENRPFSLLYIQHSMIKPYAWPSLIHKEAVFLGKHQFTIFSREGGGGNRQDFRTVFKENWWRPFPALETKSVWPSSFSWSLIIENCSLPPSRY